MHRSRKCLGLVELARFLRASWPHAASLDQVLQISQFCAFFFPPRDFTCPQSSEAATWLLPDCVCAFRCNSSPVWEKRRFSPTVPTPLSPCQTAAPLRVRSPHPATGAMTSLSWLHRDLPQLPYFLALSPAAAGGGAALRCTGPGRAGPGQTVPARPPAPSRPPPRSCAPLGTGGEVTTPRQMRAGWTWEPQNGVCTSRNVCSPFLLPLFSPV